MPPTDEEIAQLQAENAALRSKLATGAVLAATAEECRTAIVVSDPRLPDNPVIYANRAFERMTGYTMAEVAGRNCRFMQGPGSDAAAVASVGAALRDGRAVTADIFNYRKDGSGFLNELHVGPVFGPGGELQYFVGSQIDATTDRATAERLAGNDGSWRTRFERLQEGFMVGALVRDAGGLAIDWRYLEVNEAWERLMRTPRETVLGRPNGQVLPEQTDSWLPAFAQVVSTGEALTVTRRIGVLGRALEARIFRPEPGQVGVLFQDVTARLAREGRRELLVRLGELLREDADPDELAYRAAALLGTGLGLNRAGYGTIDPVTETVRIVRDWTAPGVSSLAGTLRFRDYGSYIEDLKLGVTVAINDTRRDTRTAADVAALAGIDVGAFVNMPVTEQAGFVALLFLTSSAPRPWLPEELELVREVAERTRVVIERRRAEQALRDLTASLEAQVEARTAELMTAEAQLRQSQKMEAVGQLTGGLAHDFNNLLTGITGSLELTATRITQGRYQDVERYISAAQGAARRAAALTHRLLAFSRRQTLDPKPTDINALVAGMDEFVRRTVGPAVSVEFVGAAGLWRALVDPNQLENALLNLCINARDAMPDGGRITIETANVWLDARGARERELPPGQYVALMVSDTGTGMSAETIAHAFEPFYTTKPLGEGTGLGLSMIYGFARQSGGQVRIYSELGQGTTMRLYLPRYYGEVVDAPPAEAASTTGKIGRGETVLVVDDEPTVRMLVADVLADLDYNVIEAADGPSAMRVLDSTARVDLLVTDVGLPGGMNGRQVADAARGLRPKLKVLFITGYAENAAVGNGLLEPGMHVLTKPFAIEALGFEYGS